PTRRSNFGRSDRRAPPERASSPAGGAWVSGASREPILPRRSGATPGSASLTDSSGQNETGQFDNGLYSGRLLQVLVSFAGLESVVLGIRDVSTVSYYPIGNGDPQLSTVHPTPSLHPMILVVLAGSDDSPVLRPE